MLLLFTDIRKIFYIVALQIATENECKTLAEQINGWYIPDKLEPRECAMDALLAWWRIQKPPTMHKLLNLIEDGSLKAKFNRASKLIGEVQL